MKKIFFSLIFSASFFSVMAQAPQKMTYQSVIRNTSNTLVSNSSIGMQISILQNTSSGTAVYVEQHSTTSNDNGLVTVEIGNGTPISGSLSSIDWSNGPYFIKTETDPTGGVSYTISGTSQLLSVPYALYAENSGSSTPGPTGPAGPQGTQGIQGIQGPAGPAGNVGTLDDAYDYTGSGLGRTITTDAGSVLINNSGTNTVALEINSNVSGSTGVLSNQTGVGVAFRAESTNPSNSFSAIQASTNSSDIQNSAIIGNNSGAGYGVAGQIPATATGAAAVYGNNLRTLGGSGVSGIGFNGVVGSSVQQNGFAVYGSNTGTTGLSVGTYGIGINGIYGQTTDVTNGWSGYFTQDIGVDGTGYSVGGWMTVSDRRLKSDIVPITSALDRLALLNGKYYTLTTKSKLIGGEVKSRTRKQFGVIAQDLEEVFPEMISEKAVFNNSGDDTLYKTVEYTQLVPVMLEAIKELNEKISVLEQKVQELESK